MTASERPPGSRPVPASADQSLAQLMGELTDETRTLLRQELELAKAEIRQDATQAAKAGGKIGVAAAVGGMAWLLLSFSIAWALAEVLDLWLAFAIVGVVHAVVAAVLAAAGRKQIKQVSPAPERAIDEAKETKQWAKDQT